MRNKIFTLMISIMMIGSSICYAGTTISTDRSKDASAIIENNYQDAKTLKAMAKEAKKAEKKALKEAEKQAKKIEKKAKKEAEKKAKKAEKKAKKSAEKKAKKTKEKHEKKVKEKEMKKQEKADAKKYVCNCGSQCKKCNSDKGKKADQHNGASMNCKCDNHKIEIKKGKAYCKTCGTLAVSKK